MRLFRSNSFISELNEFGIRNALYKGALTTHPSIIDFSTSQTSMGPLLDQSSNETKIKLARKHSTKSALIRIVTSSMLAFS